MAFAAAAPMVLDAIAPEAMAGGGAADMGSVGQVGISIQGNFQGFMKGLDETKKQSKTKGKESAKGLDQIQDSLNSIKKNTAFLAVTKALGIVGQAINFVVDHSVVLSSMLGAVDSIFGGMVDVLMSALVPALMPLINAFASLIPVVQDVAKEFTPLFKILGDMLSQILKRYRPELELIIKAFAELAAMGLVAFFMAIMGVITGVLEVVHQLRMGWDALVNGFNTAKGILTGVWNAISNAFGAAWNFIKGGINALINGINALLNGFVTLYQDTIGKIPGAPQLSTGPIIPTLAEGGIIKKPTLAMIGEAGPEAVVPLNRAGSMLTGSSAMQGPAMTVVISDVHIGSPDPLAARKLADLVENELRKRINMGLVSSLR